MKSIVLFLVLILGLEARTGNVKSDCTVKGKKLYGRVMIVDALEDLRVMHVNIGADLRVQVIQHTPFRCGEWMFVNGLPDLKIKFVSGLADVHIQFVNSFPGIN